MLGSTLAWTTSSHLAIPFIKCDFFLPARSVGLIGDINVWTATKCESRSWPATLEGSIKARNSAWVMWQEKKTDPFSQAMYPNRTMSALFLYIYKKIKKIKKRKFVPSHEDKEKQRTRSSMLSCILFSTSRSHKGLKPSSDAYAASIDFRSTSCRSCKYGRVFSIPSSLRRFWNKSFRSLPVIWRGIKTQPRTKVRYSESPSSINLDW